MFLEYSKFDSSKLYQFNYDLEKILLFKALEYYALLSPMKNRDFHHHRRLQLDTKVHKSSRLINVLLKF